MDPPRTFSEACQLVSSFEDYCKSNKGHPPTLKEYLKLAVGFSEHPHAAAKELDKAVRDARIFPLHHS